MSENQRLTRRALLAGVATAALFGPGAIGRAQSRPAIRVYKESTCGCCALWAKHLSGAGFDVSAIDVPDITPIKTRLGIPPRLESCHTAEIANYIVEGHVPADVVKRLLKEAPAGRGIAVPGMPNGSPGMEGRTPEVYDVILFGPHGMSRYARCRGSQEI